MFVADLAMYDAKHDQRRRFSFYRPTMRSDYQKRIAQTAVNA